MTITDKFIKQILADTPILRHENAITADDAPDGSLPLLGIFDNALDLDRFRDRVPDSNESFPETSEALCFLGTY